MDVDKIREKGRLAKELVQKGLAPDIQDAFQQIESQEMIRTKEGDFRVSTVTEVPEVEEVVEVDEGQQTLEPAKEDIKNLKRQVEHISAIFSRYQEQTDKNLIEIDARLREIKNMLSAPRAPVEEKEEQVPEISIEEMFSNAHGRLDK